MPEMVAKVKVGRFQAGLTELSTEDQPTLVDMVSMYRNINYAGVVKTDHDKDDPGKNRTAQLNSTKSGDAAGDWKKSTRYYDLNLIGSPGRKHFGGAFTPLTSSTVPYSPIVINEIGFGPAGSAGGGGDWFELKNVDTAAAQSIKNYQLSQVMGDDSCTNR